MAFKYWGEGIAQTFESVITNGAKIGDWTESGNTYDKCQAGNHSGFLCYLLTPSSSGNVSPAYSVLCISLNSDIVFYSNTISSVLTHLPDGSRVIDGETYYYFNNIWNYISPNLSAIFTDYEEYLYDDIDSALLSLRNTYPITYHSINSTVSGPSEALVGDTVVVSAVPDVGYGITDAPTQILVTNDDVAVPYTWDASNQRITFTMPQPATNRGGFGSTGQ